MSSRGIEISVTTSLVTEECYSCHVLFAMPKELKDELLKQRAARFFYCPNGHGQHYVGKTREQELAEQVERLERRATRLSAEVDQERTAHALADRRRAAAQGQLTKARKRIENGVCPACHRHFADVQRHMDSKHPSGLAAAEAS